MTLRHLITALILLCAAGSQAAWAQHHSHGGSSVVFRASFGWPWYGPYYPAPVYYPAYPVYGTVVTPVPPAVTYVEQAPAPAPAPAASTGMAGNWYYCRNPDGYYPYVKNCPGGWQAVPATPPAQP